MFLCSPCLPEQGGEHKAREFLHLEAVGRRVQPPLPHPSIPCHFHCSCQAHEQGGRGPAGNDGSGQTPGSAVGCQVRGLVGLWWAVIRPGYASPELCLNLLQRCFNHDRNRIQTGFEHLWISVWWLFLGKYWNQLETNTQSTWMYIYSIVNLYVHTIVFIFMVSRFLG